MRIAEVIGPPLFLTGLGQTRIIPIAKELVKKGNDICVFSPAAKFEKVEHFIYEGISVIKTGQYFVSCSDEFGFSKDYKRQRGAELILGIFTWVFTTIREIKKFNPDIIQIYTSQPNTLMFLLFARFCFPFTPICIDYDDIYGGEGGTYDYEQNNPILIKVLDIMEKTFPILANKLSVCSHFLAEKFSSNVIIPNSVDTELLKHRNSSNKEEIERLKQFRVGLGLKPDNKVILIVSRIKDSYDYDMVIHAVKKAFTKHKEIKVIIIGDGEGLENLKKITKEENLEEVVFFKGFVKHINLLRDYYHISDIGIIPMKARILHLARCPIKLLECISAQLCIIVPDYAECKYILKNLHNALFYKVGDIDDLASKIIEVLDNPELENNLKKNLSEIIDTFDHKQVACLWDKHLKAVYGV